MDPEEKGPNAPVEGYAQPAQQQQSYPPPGQQGYAPTGPPGYSAVPQQDFPQGQQHTTTVVLTQPPVVLKQQFREVPVRIQCPSCRADVMTATTYENGILVWLLCGIMCMTGLWLCCFIPFCLDGCKDVTHTCPNCQQVVGKFNRLG